MVMMGVVDIIMVGHFQGMALAGVALGNIYFFATVIFGWGVIMGLDPIIAQAVGANDEIGVSRGLQRGLMLAVALSILAETTTAFAPSSRARAKTRSENALPLAAEASSTLQT